MQTHEAIRPIQDEMLNKIILENLLTKGKVTIEEAKFANDLLGNILTKTFSNDLKALNESTASTASTASQDLKESTFKETSKELNESDFINLFLKKNK